MSSDLASALPGLLAAARNGDGEALNRLFAAVRPLLAKHGRSLVPPDLRAKFDSSDVVQHTLEQAFASFGTFSGWTLDEFLAWLRQVLRRNTLDAIDLYRTGKRNAAVERPLASAGHVADVSQPDDSAISREEAEVRFRALAGLSAADRQVIELRHFQELGYSVIATRLQVSENAVRKQFSRSLARWAKAIEKESPP